MCYMVGLVSPAAPGRGCGTDLPCLDFRFQCEEHPELKELYHLDKNKGYGTALHMEGIKNNGISQWHRKSYGPCKEYI